jgi:hypothetical protein
MVMLVVVLVMVLPCAPIQLAFLLLSWLTERISTILRFNDGSGSDSASRGIPTPASATAAMLRC